MADGSRLSAVIPPVSQAAAISIRKFPARRYTGGDLVSMGMFPETLCTLLEQEIRAAKTILISGGTSTGKSTLLNALADFIPTRERVVLIEDTAELRLTQPNLLAVESQPHISFEDLLKASLRWRPDRIIVGEVRGAEARTLLDSMNTGHAGSLATLHANSAIQALTRFALLVMRFHPQAHLADIEQEIAQGVDIALHIDRSSGSRKVAEVLRLTGYNRQLQQFTTEVLYDSRSNTDCLSLACPQENGSGHGPTSRSRHDHAAQPFQ